MNIKYFKKNPSSSASYLYIQLKNTHIATSRLGLIELTHTLTRVRRRGPTGGEQLPISSSPYSHRSFFKPLPMPSPFPTPLSLSLMYWYSPHLLRPPSLPSSDSTPASIGLSPRCPSYQTSSNSGNHIPIHSTPSSLPSTFTPLPCILYPLLQMYLSRLLNIGKIRKKYCNLTRFPLVDFIPSLPPPNTLAIILPALSS